MFAEFPVTNVQKGKKERKTDTFFTLKKTTKKQKRCEILHVRNRPFFMAHLNGRNSHVVKLGPLDFNIL